MERLTSMPYKNVAVATHSSWLLTLFNAVLECEDEELKKWFATGELRTVLIERVERDGL